jgi:Ty3 transposon capsid-like protein
MSNLENLLERVVQMNQIIIQRMDAQQQNILAQLASATSRTNEATESSPRSINKISIKPKEYAGSPDENVMTWVTALDEVFETNPMAETERVSTAASLLTGSALQWFVNARTKNERPATWQDFKTKLKQAFQPADLQEYLTHQLIHLKQSKTLCEYITSFRGIVGQIDSMNELTQAMLFIEGLATRTQIYVRTKHVKTLEEAIREATTYDSIIGTSAGKKRDLLVEASSTMELNMINTRFAPEKRDTPTREEHRSKGLCFYCHKPNHCAFECPSKLRQNQRSSFSSRQQQRSKN